MFQENDGERFLYRYRGDSEFTLKEIQNSEVFLVPKEKLNDQSEYVWDVFEENFEGWPPLRKRLLIIAFLEYLDFRCVRENGVRDPKMDHRLSSAKTCIDAQVEVTFREVVRQLSETKDLFLDNSGKTLTSCFSKLGMNPTMFGHYSGSGKGVVIAYNREMVERGIADSDLFLHDINYTADVFKLRLGEIPDYILGNMPKTLEQELLCRKFIDWRYEQEVRLFCVSRDRVNRIVTFPENAISGICLGPNISEDFSQDVKELCQNKKIPLFKAVRNYGVYTYSALPVS